MSVWYRDGPSRSILCLELRAKGNLGLRKSLIRAVPTHHRTSVPQTLPAANKLTN